MPVEFLLRLLFDLVLEVPFVRVFALTIIPSLLLLWYVRRKDALEPEPPRLIWSLVALGAAAVVAAGLLELGALYVLTGILRTDSAQFEIVRWFLVVGLIEEACKFAVLYLRTWKHPAFNCLFDGMVYAVAVSAGFALAENVLYLFRYGASVVLLRAVTSIPAHICFSVIMGMWYSMARKYEFTGETDKKRRSLGLCVLLPMLAHGGYDWVASGFSENTGALVLFITYVAAMFIFCWWQVKRLSGQDAYYEETAP